MKMKRIKLFEAFNSIDKIKKVNFILLCWVIENFIRDNELKSELPEHISHRYETKWGPSQFASIICFNLMSSTGRWFAYNPAREDLDIYCFKFINKYLVDNKIVNFQSMRSQSFPDRDIINKSGICVERIHCNQSS